MATDTQARLQRLREQAAALQVKIEAEEAKSKVKAVEQIQALMAEFNLTVDDIHPATAPATKKTASKKTATKKAAKKVGKKRAKPEPKYLDPVSGLTWSGQGREPNWIKGQKREKFLIQAAE